MVEFPTVLGIIYPFRTTAKLSGANPNPIPFDVSTSILDRFKTRYLCYCHIIPVVLNPHSKNKVLKRRENLTLLCKIVTESLVLSTYVTDNI